MGVRKRIVIVGGAIAAGLVAIAVSLFVWGATPSSATQDLPAEPQPGPALQLQSAASQADDLSEAVYSGLDTTKEVIGKTEARNQFIEEARDQASAKLEELGNRARQAATSGDEVLSETDQRVLKHISE